MNIGKFKESNLQPEINVESALAMILRNFLKLVDTMQVFGLVFSDPGCKESIQACLGASKREGTSKALMGWVTIITDIFPCDVMGNMIILVRNSEGCF